MKKTRSIFLTIFIIGVILFSTNTYAASMGLSISKTTAYVGETFTVTISGINGRVAITSNENVSISPSGTQWVEGSMTISGSAKSAGTGTITVLPIDVSTTSAEPEEVTSSASRSITIKEKSSENPTPTPEPTKAPTTTTNKSTTTTTTKKDTNTKQAPTPTPEPTKEEKEDNFYISKIELKGIKEDGEEVELVLSPEFKKDVYEYTCEISKDIKRINVEKDAGDYTKSVIVSGSGELKDEEENIITLRLLAEDHEEKTYKIKVVRIETEYEAEDETIETSAEIQEDNNKNRISMPIWAFILMQALIIIFEILIIKFVPWGSIFGRRNHGRSGRRSR